MPPSGAAPDAPPPVQGTLTHLDAEGNANMVDVGDKPDSVRTATASGTITMRPDTLVMILQGKVEKGDVFTVARIAGINAAKHTWELIPLAHQIPLSHIAVDFTSDPPAGKVTITASSRTAAKTGVEMEALTAVSVAALTIYDMCKAVDRAMVIGDVRLTEKRGGTHGDYTA
ncbi:MAG: cyclic pyranopterin monophosphate synthase MoaC [Chloroflexi bacterium]|nr:cyclic pyranopterin monophosphate synthase MoaC [Chloroflexota bacterium]